MMRSILRSVAILLLSSAFVLPASHVAAMSPEAGSGDPTIERAHPAVPELPAVFVSDAEGSSRSGHSSARARPSSSAIEAECDADEDVEDAVFASPGRLHPRRIAILGSPPAVPRSEALFYARHARAPPAA